MMNVTITLDPTALSADEKAALGILLGVVSNLEPVAGQAASAPEKAAPAAKKAAPAAKKAAAKKPAPVEEAEPEEEEDEDLLGGGEAYTKKDALDLATKLVGDGKAAAVKSALNKLGAARVSELPAQDDIDAFITSLS